MALPPVEGEPLVLIIYYLVLFLQAVITASIDHPWCCIPRIVSVFCSPVSLSTVSVVSVPEGRGPELNLCVLPVDKSLTPSCEQPLVHVRHIQTLRQEQYFISDN